MAKVNLQVRLDADTKSFERDFIQASKAAKALWLETEKVSDSIDKLESEIARGEAMIQRGIDDRAAARAKLMENLGRSLIAVGTAGVVGLGLAARAAIKWESDWAGVTKTIQGSTEQMAALEDTFRSMAKALPATHTQIALVAEAAGQLGIKRTDLAKFTKVMLDLGITTNLTANEAAIALARFTTIMGTSTGDIDRLGSALVHLGNNTATTEAAILHMATRIAGVGKLVGASESDVLGLSAALSEMGVEAELGSGVVVRTMLKMYNAVQLGGDKLTRFARIAGVSAEDFAAKFGDRPVDALRLVVEGLQRVEASGGNVVKTLRSVQISGTLDSQVLLKLSVASERLAQDLDIANKGWDQNNALLKEAEKRYATTASQVQIAKNQINDLGIEIGSVFLPAIAAAAGVVADLASLFKELPGPVKSAVVIIAAVGTAVALASGAFLLAIPRIAAFRAALATMGPGTQAFAGSLGRVASVVAGPLGIALAAGAVALTIWTNKKRKAREATEEVLQTLEAESGALTESTQAWAAKTLQEQKVLDSAEALGISLHDTTAAAIGNVEAQKRVLAVLDLYSIDALYAASATGDLSAAQIQQAANADKVRSAINGSNEVVASAIAKNRQLAEATEDGGSAQKTMQTAAERVTAALGDQSTAAEELAADLEILNSTAQSAEGANIDFRNALESVKKQLGEGSKSLSINTQKGRDNRESILRAIEAGQRQSETVTKTTGSIDKGSAALRANRKSLIDVVTQMTGNRKEAERYVKRLLEIPEKRKTEITTPGLDAALGKVRFLKIALDNIPSVKTVNLITKRQNISVHDIVGKAGGGLIYGPGGPRDDRAGLFALSNKEFVQPARATEYYGVDFMEAIRQLRFPRMANGGLVGAMPGGGGRGGVTVNVHVTDNSGLSERAIKRAAMTGVAQALALRP